MKTFLAVYTGKLQDMENWRARRETDLAEAKAQGVKAWKAWLETHKDVIVDAGAPLGATTRVQRDGVTDIRNEMNAYTVVRAESAQAAAALFKDHPHFTIFPGDGVEIMECLPIPDA